jgi:hypothetical protein
MQKYICMDNINRTRNYMQAKKLDAQGIEPWTLYNSDANAKHTRYHCAKRPFLGLCRVALRDIF